MHMDVLTHEYFTPISIWEAAYKTSTAFLTPSNAGNMSIHISVIRQRSVAFSFLESQGTGLCLYSRVLGGE